MAAGRAAQLQPLRISAVPVESAALVIGGGVAGMTASLSLAEQGFQVHLVERENRLGGNLNQLHYFIPSVKINGNGKLNEQGQDIAPQDYLAVLLAQIREEPRIQVHLNTELLETDGFKGNFTSTLRQKTDPQDGQAKTYKVKHGVVLVATGGVEYKGHEYSYGQDARILTQLEFEQRLSDPKNDLTALKSIVMIQCVGPAEKFCSRLCCTTALKNALKVKELTPQADVTILYRDIRTYGFKERLYTAARSAGVRFVHFEFDRKPEVLLEPFEDRTPELSVRVWEPILGADLELKPDLLVLSTPVVPPKGTRELASRLKLPVDMDGFFLEAHVKLRPVDFSADGVFMAGMAHYPKFLDESIAQAQAAASRAANILSQKTMLTNARVAVVDPQKCVGCLTCVRICPYDVPKVSQEYSGVGTILGAAYIEPAVCHGCGSCASECPAQAIQLSHYTDVQTLTKVDAMFNLLEAAKGKKARAQDPMSEWSLIRMAEVPAKSNRRTDEQNL
jgi:heterodisulfide reductase subunit A-like polyferredoxin